MTSRDFATVPSDRILRGGIARPNLQQLKAERAQFEAARRARGIPPEGVLHQRQHDDQ